MIEFILYLIGGLIVFGIVVNIIGRLERFPLFNIISGLIIGIIVGNIYAAGWGIFAGFITIGIIGWCNEFIDGKKK